MTQVAERFRLVTRSDFDGLVCAALLKELGMLDDILFVHPKDMQDGKVEVSERDITTNLPYVPGVHLAFDHHDSETLRLADTPENHVIVPGAKSAARVVYDHFGGVGRFLLDPAIMDAVDKADAAEFTREEILDPRGWDLLSFLMDPRTGLGRFRDFRVSNYQLMMQLIDDIATLPIKQILAEPDVAERVAVYREHADAAIDQVARCSTRRGRVVVCDLRHEEPIWATNRFMVYALFPECNISIHVLWGRGRQNTVFACGKSILDRTSTTNVGALMLVHGGGGHEAAGTCQVPAERAPAVLARLVEQINADAAA
jgi:nanoRNase/pAp phosphatase (c-di-AMP/oligoRNAs hydrolase)